MKNLIYLFLLLVFLTSCEKDTIEDNNTQTTNTNLHHVDKSRIMDLLNDIQNNQSSDQSRSTLEEELIDTIIEVKDEIDSPLLYIINYEDNGFVIMPADDRAMPVLAYSRTSRFNLEGIDANRGGVADWFIGTYNYLIELRDSEIEQTSDIARYWSPCGVIILTGGGNPPCPEWDNPCEDIYVQKGPLLQTNWGQNKTFNDALSDSCSGFSFFDQEPYLGCVAVAVGQVMKFHEYPNNYDWHFMSNGHPASWETAEFLAEVAESVNTDYGCTASSATTTSAKNALRYTYNYSPNISIQGFNSSKLKEQIGWFQPVILRGDNFSNAWTAYILNQEFTPHMWVCDGYRYMFFCDSGLGYNFYHMNWGWQGDENGWYLYHKFDPGNHTFNQNNKMIININNP